jgi:hypothetical protein
MKVLCIDPGKTCGIAKYMAGNLSALTSGGIADVIETLADWKPDALVVEDSTQQSFVWNTGGSRNMATSMKIARNVGEIDGYVKTLKALCDKNGTPFLGVSPLNKGSKIKADPFKKLTGYLGTTNEHERDAAMLFYPARHQLTEIGRRP